MALCLGEADDVVALQNRSRAHACDSQDGGVLGAAGRGAGDARRGTPGSLHPVIPSMHRSKYAHAIFPCSGAGGGIWVA